MTKRKKRASARYTFCLPQSMLKKLNETANTSGISVSEHIRTALRIYLQGPEAVFHTAELSAMGFPASKKQLKD